MPKLLYQLFEYYQKPENRGFRFKDAYDDRIEFGWNDKEQTISYYHMKQEVNKRAYDLAQRVDAVCMYTLEIKPIGDVSPMHDVVRLETPTKVYELFEYYLDPSNQNDTFKIHDDDNRYRENPAVILYDDRGIRITGLHENHRDISESLTAKGMLNLRIKPEK